MKLINLFSIILLALLVACSQVSKDVSPKQNNKSEPFCKGDYFEWKTNECCLDMNNNQICDKDENTTKNEVTILVQLNSTVKPKEKKTQSHKLMLIIFNLA